MVPTFWKEIGRIGNHSKNRDHLDPNIVYMGKNSYTSIGDLRKHDSVKL